jgi:acylphosphatase
VTTGGGSVRSRVVVSGQVQGVFFRHSCRREAQDRDVAGWVRNNPDGTVEAVFEGEPSAVDALVAWMRQGPRHANVASTELTQEPAEGLDGFRIR